MKLIKRIVGAIISRIVFIINFLQYKEWHKSSFIKSPIIISNKKYISIGENVRILHHARIEAICSYVGIDFKPCLMIHDNVSIQQNVHITCASNVEIGENTAIVANVTITDIIHPYTADDIHLAKQPIITKPVKIGRFCGIYNNVVINAGVHIGDHVIIGANSVVTRDIPDYCVAVGSPARVIKRYNPKTQLWEKTDRDGNFLDDFYE